MAIKAYILFKVSSGSEREVCKKIAKLDEVLEASIVYGEYDSIAKISTQGFKQLDSFTEKIRSIHGIVLTSTMVVAREYKGKLNRDPRHAPLR